jgi:excisionase family DNA binding protein
MTTAELAAALRCSKRTITNRVRDGRIPKHCFAQEGTGPILFNRVALSYFEAHSEWPSTAKEQADWARSLIKAA